MGRKIKDERAERMAKLNEAADEFEGWDQGCEVLTPVHSVQTCFPQLNLATRVNGWPTQRIGLVHGPSNHGKMHSIDEPVLTPQGWRPIGDIMVGDQVIGRAGTPVTVTGVFPQGRLETVWVNLSDGRRSRVGWEHLWHTTTVNEHQKGRYIRGPRPERNRIYTGKIGEGSVKTTRQIADTLGAGHYLPELTGDVIYDPQPEPQIDPYTLGLLIGDGGLAHGTPNFSSTYPQLVESLRRGVAAVGDTVTGGPKEWRVKGCATLEAIRGYELDVTSYTKHVPDPYLYGTPEVRWAILQGLMDTDGSPTNEGTAGEFCSTSKVLASNVADLVRSLGGRAYIFEIETDSAFGKAWRVAVSNIACPFRLDHKVARWKERIKEYRPRVKSVEDAGMAECVCIAVDADDHLYLTRDFIVTHNTAFCLGLGLSFLQRSNYFFHVDAEFSTPRQWVQELMGECAEYPTFKALRPRSYEETTSKVKSAAETLKRMRESGKIPLDTTALFVIDSIKKLVPERLMEKLNEEIRKDGLDGMKGRGAMYQASLNSSWMKELVPLLYYCNAGLVLIGRENENTNKKSQYDKSYVLGGGKDLFFDSSVVCRVTRAGWVTYTAKGNKVTTGEKHLVQITKTKVGAKDDKTSAFHFYTSNGQLTPLGFDKARDVYDLARTVGVIKKQAKAKGREAGQVWATTGQLWKDENEAILDLTAHPKLLDDLEAEVMEKANPTVLEVEEDNGNNA